MRKRSNLSTKITLILIAVCFQIAGCAGSGPVLYPNNYLKKVGQAQADQDIAECRKIASEHVSPSNMSRNVAKSTAVGAGVGAASGAVGGAIRGSAGQGAVVGAAAGASVGLIRSLFYGAGPNRPYKVFVNRCLAERGYELVGWD